MDIKGEKGEARDINNTTCLEPKSSLFTLWAKSFTKLLRIFYILNTKNTKINTIRFF